MSSLTFAEIAAEIAGKIIEVGCCCGCSIITGQAIGYDYNRIPSGNMKPYFLLEVLEKTLVGKNINCASFAIIKLDIFLEHEKIICVPGKELVIKNEQYEWAWLTRPIKIIEVSKQEIEQLISALEL